MEPTWQQRPRDALSMWGRQTRPACTWHESASGLPQLPWPPSWLRPPPVHSLLSQTPWSCHASSHPEYLQAEHVSVRQCLGRDKSYDNILDKISMCHRHSGNRWNKGLLDSTLKGVSSQPWQFYTASWNGTSKVFMNRTIACHPTPWKEQVLVIQCLPTGGNMCLSSMEVTVVKELVPSHTCLCKITQGLSLQQTVAVRHWHTDFISLAATHWFNSFLSASLLLNIYSSLCSRCSQAGYTNTLSTDNSTVIHTALWHRPPSLKAGQCGNER